MNQSPLLIHDHDNAHWSQSAVGDLSLSESRRNLASVVLVPSTETDVENGQTPQPLWQVQYYSETLESSSSESLLAQTKKEEDEVFFATFPQARRYWAPHTISNSEYFGDTGFHLGPSGFQNSWCNVPCGQTSVASASVSDETVSPSLSTPAARMSAGCSELMAAINLCGGESAAQIDSVPSQLTSTLPELDIVPKLEHVGDSLPQSAEIIPLLDPDVKTLNSPENFDDSNEPGYHYESPSDYSSPSSPSSSRGSLSAIKPPSIVSTIIPLDSPIAADPPGLMRLSPLPVHRRPVEKKKAQTLACNFCRARKIACGPPAPGTTAKICNQCQRRSRECVFPTESRRGMRKKKVSQSPS